MPENSENTTTGNSSSYHNPFPGLRPFTLNESHLFFGREGQSEEVIRNLASKKFVAVIGSSGSGKSSLIFCGLVPVLYGGFINEAGTNWKIIVTRPGNRPLANLSHSIVQTYYPQAGEEQDLQDNITLAILRRSSMGIAEAIRTHRNSPDESVLLIADQFEELFRFKRSGKDDLTFNEAEAYVNLLVQAVRQSEVPVYLVMTMRSDFIGDCSQFQELTNLINESNYLIPRMTRDDMKSAITGPVAVGGAKIDPLLVQTLLNDIGDNPDQLPILQHSLMRTWEYWKNLGDYSRPIGMADYEAIGKMEKALSEHANEAFDELDEEGKRVCESIFKTLTEKGTDNRGIRHPTRVEILAEIAKSAPARVIQVIDTFRAPGRSFLAPAHDIPLSADSVIDLSHESLMRIWNRMRTWVDEESNAIQMYQRLSEAAAMYQAGKTGLWRPPDLQLALVWKEKQTPTLTWAQRINPAFERTMIFLETSEQEYIKEEEHKVYLQKRQLRRTRTFAIVLGSAAILSLGLMLYSQVLRVEAIKQKKEADLQRTRAEDQTKLATERQLEADSSRKEAVAQTIIAQRQKEIADSNAIIARIRAEEALRLKGIADKQTQLALTNEQIAKANEDSARRQTLLATEQRIRAQRLRMLSIAQSMAVKSIQIDQDKERKGLTAQQAFLFNQKFEGPKRQGDIYNGLYEALKMLNSPGYNILKGHDGAVRAVTFIPHTTLVYSAGADGKVIRHDISDTSGFRIIIQNPNMNEAIAASPNGRWLAVGATGIGIQLFDLGSVNPTPLVINAHGGQVRSLVFSPDDQSLFSTGTDNTLVQWNLSDLKAINTIAEATRITKLVISPDGRKLYSSSRDGDITAYSVNQNFSKRTIYSEKDNPVYCIANTSSGKYLATGDLQGNIKIWSVDSGKMLASLRGHVSRVTDVQFSPNDLVLGSVGADGTVRLWDMSDFSNPPVVLQDNGGVGWSIAFSSDNQYFVSGSADESRLVFRPVSADIMARDICPRISRNMTKEEWSTYVGSDIPYENTCTTLLIPDQKK